MLENTDKAVAELLEKLPDIIQSASEQLPDIAKQLLIYGAYDAKITIVLGIVLLSLGAILGLKGIFGYDSDGCGFVGAIIIVISSIMIVYGMASSYKIEHAPKVYLIEKAAEYTNKCSK